MGAIPEQTGEAAGSPLWPIRPILGRDQGDGPIRDGTWGYMPYYFASAYG